MPLCGIIMESNFHKACLRPMGASAPTSGYCPERSRSYVHFDQTSYLEVKNRVTPAEAGVHKCLKNWIPASAGMTKLVLDLIGEG